MPIGQRDHPSVSNIFRLQFQYSKGPHPENQEHLVTCNNIREGFWRPIQEIMTALGLKCTHNSPKRWLTGIL